MFNNTKKFIALIAVLTLVASGTFALQYTMKASNEFMGKKVEEEEKIPVLHDDFDPKTNMKDVYVENLGNVDLYVRIKLSEAMSLTSYTWRPAAGDFQPHIYNPAAADCSHGNTAGKLFHDYFAWNMGGWKYYKQASGSGDVIHDTNKYTEDDYLNPAMNVKKTPDAKIITAKAFLEMSETDQKSFIGWIYDTDGYAYWSQAVKPGEATGLLLHGVTTSSALNNTNYYYVINVEAEAVDIDDIPMWLEGKESTDGSHKTLPEATEDGKEVIVIIIGGNDSGGDNNGGDDNNGGNTGGDDGDNGGNTGDDTGSGSNTGGGDGTLKEIPGLGSKTPADTVLNINGSEWIVIKNIEMEGSYYAMLLKKTAISHIIFEMSGTSYENSKLQKAFTQAFTDSHIPEVLMHNAVVPKLGDDSTSAVSAPTSKMASSAESKKDIIFPLSYKEAADWGGGTSSSKLFMDSQRWWLRTPDDAKWHYVITYSSAPNEGSITSSPTVGIKADILHLRPAIWVKYG